MGCHRLHRHQIKKPLPTIKKHLTRQLTHDLRRAARKISACQWKNSSPFEGASPANTSPPHPLFPCQSSARFRVSASAWRVCVSGDLRPEDLTVPIDKRCLCATCCHIKCRSSKAAQHCVRPKIGFGFGYEMGMGMGMVIEMGVRFGLIAIVRVSPNCGSVLRIYDTKQSCLKVCRQHNAPQGWSPCNHIPFHIVFFLTNLWDFLVLTTLNMVPDEPSF